MHIKCILRICSIAASGFLHYFFSTTTMYYKGLGIMDEGAFSNDKEPTDVLSTVNGLQSIVDACHANSNRLA